MLLVLYYPGKTVGFALTKGVKLDKIRVRRKEDFAGSSPRKKNLHMQIHFWYEYITVHT